MDRRQSILLAAEKSFAMFGYKATTVDQIAKIANVGKGTIYTFFSNKEELFYEIVNGLVKEMRHIAAEAFQEERPFYEKLHMALTGVLELRRTHQLAVKLSQELREYNTSPVKEALKTLEMTILTFVSNELEKAVEKGEVKPVRTDVASFLMMKMYLALIFDWEENHDPLNENEMAEVLETFVMNGIGK
ncbi:TetR/AcrR family transcriptional regulator [Fictibacillus aquaticus]|uniref:TetR family transcriptional regulator n=1 Tax=Fictibacillus aquaticus TaxID=2021314 RepID=A0A235FFI2_9BACL|nr:TetR/AcrR family transcriptional regulator [Fictibacillus aquaticus]OYD59697.1 TetR family transcriptional regulator [Fictibacillus aquaticus]